MAAASISRRIVRTFGSFSVSGNGLSSLPCDLKVCVYLHHWVPFFLFLIFHYFRDVDFIIILCYLSNAVWNKFGFQQKALHFYLDSWWQFSLWFTCQEDGHYTRPNHWYEVINIHPTTVWIYVHSLATNWLLWVCIDFDYQCSARVRCSLFCDCASDMISSLKNNVFLINLVSYWWCFP